jgi:hypothetical protein
MNGENDDFAREARFGVRPLDAAFNAAPKVPESELKGNEDNEGSLRINPNLCFLRSCPSLKILRITRAKNSCLFVSIRG